MGIRNIVNDVFCVGVIDYNRRLFDELIPLPFGTSYNSYIIKGTDKVALIDTVDPDKADELVENIKSTVDTIDYIVANHAEQDHAGSMPFILKEYPNAMIVTNSKCKNFILDLLHISEDKIIVVGDDETISLGDKTLKFISAPWVHWPDTMFTYLVEDKILFSSDFLGAHIADEEIFVTDVKKTYESAKRYFAQIMMPFRLNAKNHLDRIKRLDIKFIAPSHGQIYDNPKFIISAYEEWTSDNAKNQVTIPYISMHGSTKVMVDYIVKKLENGGIPVNVFNIAEADIGEIAMSLVDSTTILLGTSAVLVGPHPKALYIAYLVNILRPKARYISVIGSYGWGSKTVDIIKDTITNLKVEVLDPVMIKGLPKEDDYRLLDDLAEKIIVRHKELNLE